MLQFCDDYCLENEFSCLHITLFFVIVTKDAELVTGLGLVLDFQLS